MKFEMILKNLTFLFELKVTFFRTWPRPSTSPLAFWPFQLPNVYSKFIIILSKKELQLIPQVTNLE